MIIRRMADAIRTQNWFTVIIEIFVVMIGIFLGLQVTEWNEDRKNQLLKQEYLMRLHGEVEGLIETNNQATRRNGGVDDLENELSRYDRLKEVGEFLTGAETKTAMDTIHCRALYRSHIYFNDLLPLPTIDEMLSTGRILLISDSDMRTQLIRFSQARAESALLMENIREDRLVLSRVHPNLIKLNPTDTFGDKALCDFPAMQRDQAFINDFADNLGRYRAYAVLILEAQEDLVQDLHVSIDKAINLVHEK